MVDRDASSDERKRRRRRRSRPRSRRGKEPSEALKESQIQRDRPVTEELAPEEVAEMRKHLLFLRRHRKALRLKLNAAEDLLVNGVREPSHRGVCVHLLSKVDHALVSRALERVPGADERLTLLEGVVRISPDDGILILYLEALRDSASRAAAAGAFSLAVSRLDWAELSSARVERILGLVSSVFTESHERASVVFGLMHSASFRSVFMEASQQLPRELAGVFEPLRIVYEVVIEGGELPSGGRALKEGADILLSAPEAVLSGYPEAIRLRLLDLALARPIDNAVADRAAGSLLASLKPTSEAFREGSLRRASGLLRDHADARAKWQLRQLRGAQPDCEAAARWLAAIAAPRLGRIALGWPGEGKAPQRSGQRGAGRLRKGFWLDEQRPVWLRVGAKEKAEEFLRVARAHQELEIPGIAPFLGRGRAEDGRAWVAIPVLGRPADQVLAARRLPARRAVWMASEGVRILAALASLGWRLPDGRPERFLVGEEPQPVILLADLSGIQPIEGERSVELHRTAAFGWARDVASACPEGLPDRASRAIFRRRGDVRGLLRSLSLSL